MTLRHCLPAIAFLILFIISMTAVGMGWEGAAGGLAGGGALMLAFWTLDDDLAARELAAELRRYRAVSEHVQRRYRPANVGSVGGTVGVLKQPGQKPHIITEA